MTGWFVALVVALAPVQGIEVRQPSQGELFASHLKLDNKTQVAPVQEILTAAQQEAAPVVQQMLQLREEMLNFAMSDKSAELAAATERYSVAAGKLAAVESAAFQKIYALLKPNQQPRAVEAFEMMGGLFLPPAHTITVPPAAGRGGPGAGRGGRGGN